MNRPGEVEHLVDDSIEPRDFLVDVLRNLPDRVAVQVAAPKPVQCRLDDHQGIANLVSDDGRHPSERRQSLFLGHLALEAGDRIGQRVEGRGEQPRVLVIPPSARRQHDLAGQVAGRRNLAHDAGDGRERLGDGPGDGEAQQRPQQDGDDSRYQQLGVQRLDKADLFGSRTQDQRGRPAPFPRGVEGRRQGLAEGHELLLLDGDVARSTVLPEQFSDRAALGPRKRARQDLAVHPEGNLTAGRLLQLPRKRVVEQKPDAQRPQDFGTSEADGNRHRDQLQNTRRLRNEAEAFLSL